MMSLTEEQKRRMNENKAKAQAKLQESKKQSAEQSALPSGQPTHLQRLPLAKKSTTFKANTAQSWRKQSAHQQWEKQLHRSYSKSKFATNSKVSPVTSSAGPPTVDVLCVLDSHKRFRVESRFNQFVVSVCKSLRSSRYDPSSRTWSLDLEEHENFVRRLRENDGIKVVALPTWILATFQGRQPIVTPAIELLSVDEKLVNALMPFQREGIEFGIRNQGRVLIADDMGLGKTIQAIGIACYYRREWPLLIICPSSVRMAWADALLRWLPSLKSKEVCVAFNTKVDLWSGLVAIVSYDLAVRFKETLKSRQFQIVIADECHFLKNHKSLRSNVCLPLLKSSKRAVLLSGTPALSRPSELYTQIDAVAPKLFHSFIQFGVRYCDGRQKHFGWDFGGASNLEELQVLLEQKVMIRRLKSEVLSQLPDKVRQVVKLDPSLVKASGLKQAEKEFQRAVKLKACVKRTALLGFYRETAEAKCAAAVDYVSDLMESGMKVLIFAHHRIVMDALCNALDSKKHQYIRIDGSTVGEDRLPLCDEFQSNPSVLAAVLSVTAANTGLNLTAASVVVFAELYWNPGVLIQAEDRVYRIGQKNSVTVRYLIASGTADDYMWPLLQNKLRVLERAGLSKDDFAQSDYEVHQDSKQKTIMQCFEELASTLEPSIPQTAVDDANHWLLEDDMFKDDILEGFGADESCEPETKRPRLQ